MIRNGHDRLLNLMELSLFGKYIGDIICLVGLKLAQMTLTHKSQEKFFIFFSLVLAFFSELLLLLIQDESCCKNIAQHATVIR